MLGISVFGTLLYLYVELRSVDDHFQTGEPAGERIADLSAAGSEGAFPSGRRG